MWSLRKQILISFAIALGLTIIGYPFGAGCKDNHAYVSFFNIELSSGNTDSNENSSEIFTSEILAYLLNFIFVFIIIHSFTRRTMNE